MSSDSLKDHRLSRSFWVCQTVDVINNRRKKTIRSVQFHVGRERPAHRITRGNTGSQNRGATPDKTLSGDGKDGAPGLTGTLAGNGVFWGTWGGLEVLGGGIGGISVGAMFGWAVGWLAAPRADWPLFTGGSKNSYDMRRPASTGSSAGGNLCCVGGSGGNFWAGAKAEGPESPIRRYMRRAFGKRLATILVGHILRYFDVRPLVLN